MGIFTDGSLKLYENDDSKDVFFIDIMKVSAFLLGENLKVENFKVFL